MDVINQQAACKLFSRVGSIIATRRMDHSIFTDEQDKWQILNSIAEARLLMGSAPTEWHDYVQFLDNAIASARAAREKKVTLEEEKQQKTGATTAQ